MLSQPVTLQLTDYFGFARISGMQERTLTTIHDVTTLDHRGAKFAPPSHNTPNSPTAPAPSNGFAVTLLPSQIRTFFVEFQPN